MKNWLYIILLLRWSLLGVFLWCFSAKENVFFGLLAYWVACTLEIRRDGVQPRSWKFANIIGYGFPVLVFALYVIWVSLEKPPFGEVLMVSALSGFAAGMLLYRDWKYSSKMPKATAA